MASPSRSYAWYVLALLTALNFVNYADRMVIVTMYDDLRSRFGLSDEQLGMFQTAFFTVHALTIVPFGWASDRYNRLWIMAAGVIGWSLATLGSAYAVGFLSLLVLRGLIGVGEACYGPVSNALLCEIFPPGEKAKTVGIFNGGMFVGACVGMAAGALLGFPLAFQLMALPGLALGVLVVFLKVPARRVEGQSERPSLATITRVPTLRWMLVSGVLISFAAGGYVAWINDFVKDYIGLSIQAAALVLAPMVLTAGTAGVIVGGVVADRLQRRYPYGRLLTISIGFFAAIPFGLLLILFPGYPPICYPSIWFLMFFLPWYNGPMAAVIDDLVDDKEANTAQATFSFLLHLIGTGPASLVLGAISTRTGDLRIAFLLPVVGVVLAAVFCLVACRSVERDRAAKLARREPAAAAA